MKETAAVAGRKVASTFPSAKSKMLEGLGSHSESEDASAVAASEPMSRSMESPTATAPLSGVTASSVSAIKRPPPPRSSLADAVEDSGSAAQSNQRSAKFASQLDDEQHLEVDLLTANQNEQFAEEDHYTNRTEDPRIGTHGRKNEP